MIEKKSTKKVAKTRLEKTGSVRASTKVRKHANVASRTIDGQEVVIVPSSRKLQMLNEVATRIWALCDGRSVKEIAEAIADEYAVGRTRALRDVKEFIAEIHKRRMVELT